MDEFSDQIGDRLQHAREAAGLTLEDVHFRTRIPTSVAGALEAGDFSVFSSPAYAKSFLAQYSAFLEVDATPWLEALVPASFISGEFIQPEWMQAEERPEVVKEPAGTSVGWSALSVFAVSAALIFAAVQGFQLLERRLGNESRPPEPVVKPHEETPVVEVAGPRVPVSPLESAAVEDSSRQNIAAEDSGPPPRALIVR